MKREWKPGDVAMAYEEAVVFTDAREWVWATTGLACISQPPDGLHRVALVDFENREQVERLCSLHPWHGVVMADDMQAALREFANPTPPKPEPTDPAARVIDEDGDEWARRMDGKWICLLNGATGTWDGFGPDIEVIA